MKTVFNNQMVAHVWAQMKQPHGRNPGNSKHFDGSVAYSYQTPVAHIIETDKLHGAHGERVLLYVPNQWGVTTGQHIASYQRAFSGGPAFEVPDIFPHRFHIEPDADHSANIEHLLGKYEKARAELMRVPCDSWRVRNVGEPVLESVGDHQYRVQSTAAHETLRELALRLERYCIAFAVKRTAAQLPSDRLDANAIIARRDRLLADPKRAAKREARENAALFRQEREAKEKFEQQAEARGRWERGEDIGYRHISDETGGALLRVSNGGYEVVTSWGASVPLADAKVMLPRLFAARANIRGTVSYLVCDWGIGQFTVDEVNTRGIKAGCHTINWAELERFAAVLGIAS